MRLIIWPETVAYSYHECFVCKTIIDSEANSDGKQQWYTPSSRYWNVAKKEIYCNVDHMWQRHLNIINNDHANYGKL